VRTAFERFDALFPQIKPGEIKKMNVRPPAPPIARFTLNISFVYITSCPCDWAPMGVAVLAGSFNGSDLPDLSPGL